MSLAVMKAARASSLLARSSASKDNAAQAIYLRRYRSRLPALRWRRGRDREMRDRPRPGRQAASLRRRDPDNIAAAGRTRRRRSISASISRAAPAMPEPAAVGPGRHHHIAGAIGHQTELFGQRRDTRLWSPRRARDRRPSGTTGGNCTSACARLKGWSSASPTRSRARPSPPLDRACRPSEHARANDVRANARIVAAEGRAEMAMARHVVGVDADPAIVERGRDVAAEKRRRPAAMIGFEQQIAVARALRQRHQFAGPVARQRRLAAEIGVEPQAPFGLVGSRCRRPALRRSRRRGDRPPRPRRSACRATTIRAGPSFEQKIQLAAHPLVARRARSPPLRAPPRNARSPLDRPSGSTARSPAVHAVIASLRRQSRLAEMMGQQFRLVRGDLGKRAFERAGDALVPFAPARQQQALISGVAHQRVLETEAALLAAPFGKDDACGDEFRQRRFEIASAPVGITASSSANANCRPITEAICATSRASPSRSSRAISKSFSVAGTARRPRPPIP